MGGATITLLNLSSQWSSTEISPTFHRRGVIHAVVFSGKSRAIRLERTFGGVCTINECIHTLFGVIYNDLIVFVSFIS